MQPTKAIYTGSAHRRMACYLLNTVTCRMDDDGFTETFAHIVLLEEENSEKFGQIKQVPIKDVRIPLEMYEYRWLNTKVGDD